MQKRLEGIIRGDVQGVSLRGFTREKAQEFGLVGSVRNLPDGTVELIAEGEEGELRELLAAIRSDHPFAKVERIEEAWGEATGEFKDFRILYRNFLGRL